MPPPPVTAAEVQPAASGGGEKAGPSEFIKKLYNMLEEESVQYGINNGGKVGGDKKGKGRQERGAVGWGRGGQTFVVWEMNEFTTKVLWVPRNVDFSGWPSETSYFSTFQLLVVRPPAEQVWFLQGEYAL
jgi:hypothetical protein